MRKIWVGIIQGIIVALMVTSIAYAVPGNITDLRANPSTTSIYLIWTKASASTSTLIRYRTDQFPANTADGTQAYSGAGFFTTLTGLTSGTVYFFSIWGYDGADYSVTKGNLAVTTLAGVLPSGGSQTASITIPTRSVTNLTTSPDASGLNLEPFTSIVNYFTGGIGMPINNVWESLYLFGVVGIGVITYVRMKHFFMAFITVLVLSIIGVTLDLVQGYLIGIEIVIALGVWTIDSYFQ